MANREQELWALMQCLIGVASLWPVMIRRLFWTPSINHFERVLIATFVFVNGIEPTLFLEWARLKRLASSDASQHHLEYLLAKFEENPNCYRLYAYNVAMNRYEWLDGTCRMYTAKHLRK